MMKILDKYRKYLVTKSSEIPNIEHLAVIVFGSFQYKDVDGDTSSINTTEYYAFRNHDESVWIQMIKDFYDEQATIGFNNSRTSISFMKIGKPGAISMEVRVNV